MLVGGLVAIWFIFTEILGIIIIPIDALIFFRGVKKPPTRYVYISWVILKCQLVDASEQAPRGPCENVCCFFSMIQEDIHTDVYRHELSEITKNGGETQGS